PPRREAGLRLLPADDRWSYSGRRRGSVGVEYVQRVSQVRDLARSYWFDALVAALGIVAILEVVLGFGSPGAPQTTLWFSVPAIVVLVLAVFARRLFPFAGPAVYWLLAAGISVADPLLVPYPVPPLPLPSPDPFLLPLP